MKAKDVLKILQVNRVTLYRYVKSGKLKVTQKPSGQYDYDDDCVYELAGWNDGAREKALYIRGNDVPPVDQTIYDVVYSDNSGSGLGLDYRPGLVALIKDVINHRVGEVSIANPQDLSLTDFHAFKSLFESLGCKVKVGGVSVKDPSESMKRDLARGLREMAAQWEEYREFQDKVLQCACIIDQQ